MIELMIEVVVHRLKDGSLCMIVSIEVIQVRGVGGDHFVKTPYLLASAFSLHRLGSFVVGEQTP